MIRPGVLRASEDPALRARVVAEHALKGVGAGSALLQIDERLLAVHDDAFRVSWIDLPSLEVTPLVLAGDGAPLPKASKPDFESAVYVARDESVHLIGSGSTEGRCTLARIDLAASTVTFAVREDLFLFVQAALELDVPPNIEGACVDGGLLRLFHRGVRGARSGYVELYVGVLYGEAPRRIRLPYTFELGTLDGVPLGVTDAAMTSPSHTVFVAAAEDTADAVSDGAVTGSVVGIFEDERSIRWARLMDASGEPYRGKVEGIVVDEELIGGWVITDADDATSSAKLCQIELAGFVPEPTEVQTLLREMAANGLVANSYGWKRKTLRSYADRDYATAESLMLRAESKVVKKWVQLLPSLGHLRNLWIKSRANQALFDAACGLNQLRRLHVGWSSIETCDALDQLVELTHFALGNSPRLKRFEPLARMPRLQALELQGIFRNVPRLDELASVSGLKGLALVGQEYKNQFYESLAPIGELSDLQYLAISAVRIRDGNWRPLTKLRKLEYLRLPPQDLKRWPRRAYRDFHESLPLLKGSTVRLAATDEAFQAEHGIK